MEMTLRRRTTKMKSKQELASIRELNRKQLRNELNMRICDVSQIRDFEQREQNFKRIEEINWTLSALGDD